jgi:hypothetical protein
MPGLNGFDRAASREDFAHAKRFDKWFYSLPAIQQDKLREEGVVPYKEARSPDHVFPVYERASIWLYDPREDETRTETESFISRETVGRIVHDVVDLMGYTTDPTTLRHWELMRAVLRVPGHLNGPQLAKLFGISKQGISMKAKQMLARVDRRLAIARGLAPDPSISPPMPPGRKSTCTPPTRRVAEHLRKVSASNKPLLTPKAKPRSR